MVFRSNKLLPRVLLSILWVAVFIGFVSLLYSHAQSSSVESKSSARLAGNSAGLPKKALAPTPTDSTASPDTPLITNHYIVRSGDTFSKISNNLGIEADVSFFSWKKLRDLGLSAIYPGDSIVVEQDSTGSIHEVSILTKLSKWFHLSFAPDTVSAWTKPVQVTVYQKYLRATLHGSLYQSIVKQGGEPALVMAFSDVFAWDINFFTDPQPGDSFSVIYETKFFEGHPKHDIRILYASYHSARNTFEVFSWPDSNGTLFFYDQKGKSVEKQFLKAPLRYSRISSGYTYNRKHPILGIVRPHLGIDYAAPRGTPVYASAEGVVSFAGAKGGYGNMVIVAHGGMYETYYGHLHTISRGIRRGIKVAQGQLIGTVGSTGLSTGPHLDYRMKKNGAFINPLTITAPSLEAIPDTQMHAYQDMVAQYNLLSRLYLRSGNGSTIISMKLPDD